MRRDRLKNLSQTDLNKATKQVIETAQRQISNLLKEGYKLTDEQKELVRRFGSDGELDIGKVRTGTRDIPTQKFNLEKGVYETVMKTQNLQVEDIMSIRQVALGEFSTVQSRRRQETKALQTIQKYYNASGNLMEYSKIGKGSYSIRFNKEGERQEWTSEMINDFWDTLHEIGEVSDIIYNEVFASTVEIFNQNFETMSIGAMTNRIKQKYGLGDTL